jgi:hypothetical protein
MSLSAEESEKCDYLYKIIFREEPITSEWNEEAALLLAEIYSKICTCSKAMNNVPRPTIKPSLGWLFMQVYGIIYRSIISKNGISEACRAFGVNTYRSKIEMALLN